MSLGLELDIQNYSAFTSHNIPIFIHGWVKDIENGVVSDLGVSVGPPGVPIPKSPFPAVIKRNVDDVT